MEFTYDGGGLGKGGTVALYVDGDKTGEGRVEGTVPMIYSADETCDIGLDTSSPVSDDYISETSRFNGTVERVKLDIADAAEDLDHPISPEERLKIAMTRQRSVLDSATLGRVMLTGQVVFAGLESSGTVRWSGASRREMRSAARTHTGSAPGTMLTLRRTSRRSSCGGACCGSSISLDPRDVMAGAPVWVTAREIGLVCWV